MWIFTEDGFFSVVAYHPNKDMRKSAHVEIANASEEPDNMLLIRARVKADLERLQENVGTDIHIINDPSADYSHRALMTRKDWAGYLATAAMDIDYDSHFKEVVRDRAPKADNRYSAMMSVWTAMARLQDTVPYSGTPRTSAMGDWYSTQSPLDDDWNVPPSGYALASGGFTSSHSTWKPKPTIEHAHITDEAESVETMLDMLTTVAPKNIDIDTLANSDDAAFALWLAAMDDNRDGDEPLAEEQLLAAVDRVSALIDAKLVNAEFDIADRDFDLIDRDMPEIVEED